MSRRRRKPAQPNPAPLDAGHLREIIRAELAELTKTLALPAGTTARPVSQAYLAQLTQQHPQARAAAVLPRDEFPAGFGPGAPLIPAALDPVLSSGRAAPRRYEYPVSWNLATQSRHVPFTVLRDVAEKVSIVRQCIEIRKSSIIGMDWAFTIDPTRVKQLAAASGQPGHEVRSALAEKHADTIARLQEWWARPDRINGWNFEDWMNALLEEHLVLDAVTAYPHLTLGGDLHSFELLDGSTIKPLLDRRGAVPQPPYPAYQQVLHGFPRGEFTASPPEEVDAEFVSGVYGRPVLTGWARTDALVYKVRNRRTHSPYGLSCTEQALVDADLYLKRTAWLGAEYDDGVVPDVLMKLDVAGITPEQLTAYESVFNDELAGRAKERRRAKFLPAGFEPVFPPSLDSKFSPDMDLHLIRLICADFDVMPSELGFVPLSGLGGKGHQEGERESSDRRGTRPTARWVTGVINELSRAWLGMPAELTFRYLGLEEDDEAARAQQAAADVHAGLRTMNEGRDLLTLPRYAIPEADRPFVMAGGVPAFLDAAAAANTAGGETGPGDEQNDDEQDEGPGAPARSTGSAEQARRAEAKAFLAFAAKRADSGRWRDFRFLEHDPVEAAAANQLGAAGDLDAARALFDLRR